jgi:hypothetical protein
MKYKVVFRERSDREGEKADNPVSFLDAQLDDETVLDSRFVGRNRPEAQHSSDALEEDDDFLSLGTEVWEYDVADGKDREFKDALLNSGVVLEFEPLESSDELGVA